MCERWGPPCTSHLVDSGACRSHQHQQAHLAILGGTIRTSRLGRRIFDAATASLVVGGVMFIGLLAACWFFGRELVHWLFPAVLMAGVALA